MSNLPIIETINTNIANLKNTRPFFFKQDIKNAVNTDYDFISNEQIGDYPSLIKQGIAYYKNRVPHSTKEGSNLTLNTVPLKFDNMIVKGNTEQARTSINNGDEYDSPSLDHPQDIHVVTGNNTITVNNTDYPLNLGNIELCKIGNYQDEIVKIDNTWKIPNKIIKIDNYNSETIATPYISTTGSLDEGATVYYVSEEDYIITNETLIAQLNALEKAKGNNGTTIITSNGDDLSPILNFTAYLKEVE